MKSLLLKKETIITILMVCAMVFLSEICHEKEFIFPEITALTIGFWLAPKRIWKTSPLKSVLLIGLYAVLGVIFVRYIPLPFVIEVPIAFVVCAIGLILSRTTFAPLISACILPILLHTESWIYPISATIMTIIIVLVKKGLDIINHKESYHYTPVEFNTSEIPLWIKRFIVVLIMTLLVEMTGIKLLMAPPLLVGFIELSGDHKKLRSIWKQLLLMTSICALVACVSRLVLCNILNLPLTLAALVSTLTLLICLFYFYTYFPPIGAIAILPMLIDESQLTIYPLAIIIGFSLLIFFAFMCHKDLRFKHV